MAISTVLYDRADSFYDDDGHIQDGGYYEKQEYAFYLEYGLNSRITLVGRLAWQDVARLDAGNVDTVQGFAASEAGARLMIWRNDHSVISGQITALAPGDGENITDHDLGEGAVGAEIRALVGRSLGSTTFIDLQAAYRWRDQSFQDEARFDLTFGWRPRPNILVLAQEFSTWSVTDPMIGRRAFSHHKIQASIGFTTSRGDIHIGGYMTPAGRNAIAERAIFFGLWQQF